MPLFVRKLLLVTISLLCSALLAEAMVRFGIGFPTLGVKETRVIYPKNNSSGTQEENIYFAFSKYYNTEGGYKTYRYNNLGLPGLSVVTTNHPKSIVVLGNSFVESRSMSPERMATSVAMKELRKADQKFQVINLAKGGQIPELGFYRLQYWQSKIHPYRVILVLESNMLENIQKYGHGILMDTPSYLTMIDMKSAFMIKLLNSSSLINMIRVGFKYGVSAQRKQNHSIDPNTDKSADSSTEILAQNFQVDKSNSSYISVLIKDLNTFHSIFGSRFMVLSLLDSEHNAVISEVCQNTGIAFESNSELRNLPSLHLGKGHFNEAGNFELGSLIAGFVLREENKK